MTECLIAFGGNLSNPKVTFQVALEELSSNGFGIKGKSGLWRSPAWPAGSGQPAYLNAVVKGEYEGTAENLLKRLQTIEVNHGRVRSVPNAARTLDLDLLVFGDLKIDTEFLTLPHPRMLRRPFVLVPACEIDMKWLRYLRKLPDAEVRQTEYAGAW